MKSRKMNPMKSSVLQTGNGQCVTDFLTESSISSTHIAENIQMKETLYNDVKKPRVSLIPINSV